MSSHLMEEPWLRACKRLPVGGKARFRCCGRTPAAVLFHKVDAYEMYCHRCHQPAYVKKQFIQLGAATVEPSVQPVPAQIISVSQASPEIQSLAYSFIVSKGLMPDMAGDVSWAPEKKRLLFPVSSGTYLARAMTEYQIPKWLQMGPPVQYAVAAPDAAEHVKTVVLVEDWLSALKLRYVSQRWCGSTVLPVALLGTRLSPKLKSWLVDTKPNVLLALDGDSAGQAGTAVIHRTLRPFVEVREYSKPGHDPKDLQISEILEAFNV